MPFHKLEQTLERSQTPHTIRFVPKNDRDRSPEDGYEEIRPRKTLHEQRKISNIKNRGENSVEEVPWKHKPPKLDEMPQYADFHLGHQRIIPTCVILAYQTELAQLFKVMMGHVWTAEV
jgi:hypothetical protein